MSVNLVTLEVDGRAVQVPAGSMVMEAANRLGIHVPHFCWHKRLSIAANCRMCLVQVEKAPKPLPACATPVAEGMKVHTASEIATKAQRGVMEFLLINHPLDCPICDQGGECQLQDLAVGYGGSASRFTEGKRVVPRKDIGPLVSAEEMSRCIHCTRCVRFGQEIAGVMELGMAGRGEHSEILSFVGKSVDSELSGNMIDLCPVGALTSKPFRYSARTWELARRRTVSPHCGLGSRLVVQVKGNRVLRVIPHDADGINDCWLSDKDRFSYEGLNSADRLTRPMVRRDGQWAEVSWQEALEFAVDGLRRVTAARGGDALGTVISPHATLEELFLAKRVAEGLGSPHVDFRLRQVDDRLDAVRPGAPWLGRPIAEVAHGDRVLVIGSNLRKDHPLIAARLRVAQRAGLEVAVVTCTDDEQLIPLAHRWIVAPDRLPHVVAALATAAGVEGAEVPREQARAIVAWLRGGTRGGSVFIGNLAQHHPEAAVIESNAAALAAATGRVFGVLGEAANSVGGWLAGALPGPGGLSAHGMFAAARAAYVLVGCEPELDGADGAAALRALSDAQFVVALSPWQHRAIDYADVLLPIAPFTETAGTFVNTEGRVQSFKGVVQPLGETRPGWKVLRVLGSLLGLAGTAFDSAEDVRIAAIGTGDDVSAKLANVRDARPLSAAERTLPADGLQRIGDVPIHFADPLARRSSPLQATHDARPPRAAMNAATLRAQGLGPGDEVRVTQGPGEARLFADLDPAVPDGCVRVAAAHASTAHLGGLFDAIDVERVASAARASA
jgi:NADH-quinone oxidoreductase subunit G